MRMEIKFTADGTNQGSTTELLLKKSFAVYYNTNTQGTAGNYVKVLPILGIRQTASIRQQFNVLGK